VTAALDAGVAVTEVFVGVDVTAAARATADRAAESGIRVRQLADGVAGRVSDMATSQGVFALAPLRRKGIDALAGTTLAVVAPRLSDPGNAGTLMRSAAAAGAGVILLGPGSVDAYNPKVVRASAGAIFGIAVVDAESEGWSTVEALHALGRLGRQRLGATAARGTPYAEADFTRPTAVVLGNEAHGLGDDVAAALDGHVTIPMAGPAESLNVAMAGTVLCFESGRQRRAGAGA
jgi:TrmH family RNA methyltransferase